MPFPPPGVVPPADDIPDANQGTFYSSMMNVDFEIGDGNPAAVAIRSHVAQHGVLSHMDFHIGSGLAAHHGGRQRRAGPAVLRRPLRHPHHQHVAVLAVHADRLACSTGQREAAIREHLAGLTVVRTTFRNVPIGISIDRGLLGSALAEGRAVRERRDRGARDRQRAEPDDADRRGRRDLLERAGVRARTGRADGRTAAPAPAYTVRSFHHGLFVRGADSTGEIDTRYDAVPLPRCPRRCRPRSAPCPRPSSGSTCTRSA